MTDTLKHVTIYTDGGCRGNPGIGGWGVVLNYDGHEKHLFGGEAETTNNRMELTAAIKALQALKQPCAVTLYTDSQYVKQGIEQWLANWRKNNWRTAAKKAVKNQDLWQLLDTEVQRHKVKWDWVKGHSGNPGNELADELANRGMDQLLES